MSDNAPLEDKIQKQKDMDSFKENILEYLAEVQENPDKLDELTDEQIIELHKAKDPYKTTIAGDEQFACLSYTNLREKYLEKLLTTSMVGFVYRACAEYEIDEDTLSCAVNKEDFKVEVVNPDSTDVNYVKVQKDNLYVKAKDEFLQSNKLEEYNLMLEENPDGLPNSKVTSFELSVEDEILINESVAVELQELLKPTTVVSNEKYLEFYQSKIQEQSQSEQLIITRFLNRLFEYNPDVDVKSSHCSKEAAQDKNRKPLAPSSDTDNTQSMDEMTLLETKVPSKDFYYKFGFYKDVNYEVLRECVNNIYGMHPDLEIAFNVYDVFSTIDKANEYVEKYKDKIITDIKTVTTNKWVFSGPFEENREKVTFFNENTIVLENIMSQMKDDAETGARLLKDKVKKKKIKNIKEVGPDHPKFQQYKKEFSSHLAVNGAFTNEDLEENKPITIVEEIEVGEDGQEVDEDGCPKNALEIGVFHVNAAEGTLSNSKLYTKARKPNGDFV
jgi:hypothetical protein